MTGDLVVHLGITWCTVFIATISLSLLVTQAGLISAGHIAFLGVGGYTAGIVVNNLGNSIGATWLGLACAVLVGGIIAAILGGATRSLRGDGFILASLCWLLAFGASAIACPSVTNGPLGLKLEHNWSQGTLFLVVLCAALAAAVVCVAFVATLGPSLRAQQSGDAFCQVIGLSPSRLRWKTFFLACTLGALAGTFQGFHIGSLYPATFAVEDSVVLIAVAMFGSTLSTAAMGRVRRWRAGRLDASIVAWMSLGGALVASGVFTVLPEAMRWLVAAHARRIVFGLLLVILLVLRHEEHPIATSAEGQAR